MCLQEACDEGVPGRLATVQVVGDAPNLVTEVGAGVDAHAGHLGVVAVQSIVGCGSLAICMREGTEALHGCHEHRGRRALGALRVELEE